MRWVVARVGVEARSGDPCRAAADTVTASLTPNPRVSHRAEDRIDLDMVQVLRSQSPGARPEDVMIKRLEFFREG